MKYINTSLVIVLFTACSTVFAEDQPTNTNVNPSEPNTAPGKYNIVPYVTVSVSPYLGQKTAFDASDVWSQQSSMNEDLYILQYRQKLEKELNKHNASLAQRPILEISGAVEGMAIQTFNNFSNSGPSGDINLNTAELDLNAMASNWAIAFLSINYDSAPPQTGSRVTNSRIYLSRGFATIGNLDVTPFYFSIGQLYLPFGRYSSNMVTAPLTLSLARVNDRAAILGYYQDGLLVQLYTYPGIDANNADTIFHAGGFNVAFKRPFGEKLNFSMGGGMISDMTDSQGMGYTGASFPQFPGFANVPNIPNVSSGFYPFAHVIPGGDIHSEISYGPWSFALEFISALTNFANQDMTFNNHGASPKATHIEIANTFEFWNYSYTAGGSYGRTWESLALNLPQQSFTIYLRTSWWKNTIEALEFRHDIDYSENDIATAATKFGSLANNDNSTATFIPYFNKGTGKSRDLILFQLGVYF